MEQSFEKNGNRTFYLPPGLEDLRGYPLYILIAVWGVRQHHILTTTLVSRAFFITQSQARDALHYMRHEGGKRVKSETVPLFDGMHPHCKGVRVLSVDQRDVPVEEKRRTVGVISPGNVTERLPRQTLGEDVQRRLRQWMVSRRAGEPVPSALLAGGRDNERCRA